HQRGAWLSCHARADESVKLALKYGFRVIYHCDFIEGETFDLLEAQRDKVFAQSRELFTMLDNCPRVYSELKKRGMRILPGGDYGFAWNPIGTNARDL